MIFNEDCVEGAKKYLLDETIDLMVCDPPFGIQEATFDKHYKRKKDFVIEGYQESPDDYAGFSDAWIGQAKRVLKPDGSLYIISGWSHLAEILNATNKHNLQIINHIIWKFNFGVATQNKFVTSHYHVLYLKKPKGKVKFNTFCRFGAAEKDHNGGSLLYQDMEDVWYIKKDYQPGQVKNKNKLPDALLAKIIQYSSDPGDIVCDFFLGNFTTALVAKRLGRVPSGFEVNAESFNYWTEKLNTIESGCDLGGLKKVEIGVPENRGKTVTDEEIALIKEYYTTNRDQKTKKKIIEELCVILKRGRFSILNLIEKIENVKESAQ